MSFITSSTIYITKFSSSDWLSNPCVKKGNSWYIYEHVSGNFSTKTNEMLFLVTYLLTLLFTVKKNKGDTFHTVLWHHLGSLKCLLPPQKTVLFSATLNKVKTDCEQ